MDFSPPAVPLRAGLLLNPNPLLKITVPPFVGIGEMIAVDTRTGEYLSRVK